MSVLPAQAIRKANLIFPCEDRRVIHGLSYGLSPSGYDIRIREDILFWPFRFVLASTIEHFEMPNDVVAHVCDKSTWARQGLFVQNTIIEPGWIGTLTVELTLNSFRLLRIRSGSPIAQVIFHRLEEPTEQPYSGKYNYQPRRPVKAILE